MKKPMRAVSEAEAKQRFDAILDEVAQGAEIAITRKGKEVARIIPSKRPRLTDDEFLRRAAELRARQPKQTSLAEDLIREDRDR